MSRPISVIAFLLAVAYAGDLEAGEPEALESVHWQSGSIEIDGRADDEAWANANWRGGFVQRTPNAGMPASEPTQVAVLHDRSALYVYVEARDSRPQSVLARLTRRDEESASDWIELWLAPQGDRRSGYRFAVNPRGVKVDSRLSDAGEHQDRDWNGVWQVATHRTTSGWCAEFRIPFSQLRFQQPGLPWGVNVVRKLARLHEESVLSPTPRSASRPLKYLADLRGMEGLTARSKRLELRPYISMTHDRFGDASDLVARGGGDIDIGLGASRTLQLTVLPDFGQVQSDPSQLNLSAFELFLPEKRQFFLDGREVFRFPLAYRGRLNESLFYSRRIGAPPSRTWQSDGTTTIEQPTQVPITVAAKLVGRESAGVSYGLLAAKTEEATAVVVRDKKEERFVVAPPSDFGVGRIRLEFDHSRGSVGMMVTQVSRHLPSELRPILIEHASAGAADFEYRLGNYGILFNALGTRLSGTPNAIDLVQRSTTNLLQRPDGHHLDYDPERRTLTGWGAELVGGKLDGSPWRAFWGVRARSPGLNPNDLGYLQRADNQHAEVWLQRREDHPSPYYRYWHVAANGWVEKTFGPEVTSLGGGVTAYLQLPDHSASYAGIRRHLEALDVSLLRGGPAFLMPGRWEGFWGIGTDERRPLEVDLDVWGEVRDQQSLTRTNVSVALSIHPTSAIRLSLAPALERSRDDLQYVTTNASQSAIVGRLHRTTAYVTLRASWAVSTHVSFEAYAMPYLTAGKYSHFQEVAAPKAESYADRLVAVRYEGLERFSLGQMRSNLLLRWEYHPGSIAYLVWSRELTNPGEGIGAVRWDRDMVSLFRSRPNDSVMVKVMHWLSL